MTSVETILEHHGIKGMKWGSRKDDSSGTGSGSKSGPASDDHSRAAAVRAQIKTGGTKSVSNRELQDLVTRMNLEQQYSRLASQKTTTLSSGQAKVRQILGVAKTAQEIHSLATGGLAKAVASALKK